MRGKILLGAAALVAVVLTLHTTVLDRVVVYGAKPDLLLAIVVYVSLRWGPVAGTIAGFVLGLLQDAQSLHGLGMNAAAKAVVGYAISHTWEALDKESVYTQMVIILAAGLLHGLVFCILYSGSEISTAPGLFLRLGVPGAAYTAVSAPLLLAIIQRVIGHRMELSALPRRQK